MKSNRFIQFMTACFVLAVIFCGIDFPLLAQSFEETPPNFKIAFIGDQGLGPNARKVLNLIKAEGAQAVIHSGDFDYQDNPAAWEAQINNVLGPDFPYFASIGNHDEKKWSGTDGYQQYLMNRLTRLGINWDGDLGVKSSLYYKGLFIIQVAPGIMGACHDAYIQEKLAADSSLWRICNWHKNMQLMQVGGKGDETGWSVYEEARKGGAIIATAHEHSYSRTHLLSSIVNQTVASRSDTLVITQGKTFVFVSGLGGESIRNQERSGDWWARVYTSNQGANYGALFGTFNVNGVSNLATFYFKDIKGMIADSFVVISNVKKPAANTRVTNAALSGYVLEQNYPNPFNVSTLIRFHIPQAAHAKLTITDLMGHEVLTLFEGDMPAGDKMIRWTGCDRPELQRLPSGAYWYRLESSGQGQAKKLLLIK